MNDRRLDSMLQWAISIDLETDLIQPGLLAPPIVLGSAAEARVHPAHVERGRNSDGSCWDREVPERVELVGKLLLKADVMALFDQVYDNPNVVLCGANIAYDLLCDAVEKSRLGVDVMGKIFAMYDPNNEVVKGDCDGRVFEIQLAEPLHAIAQGHVGKHALTKEPLMNKATGRPGRYSLDNVTFEVQGREDAKTNDIFRLSFHQFHGVPLHLLPFQARQYPVDDAKNTHGNALGQAGHLPSVNPHDWQAERVAPFHLRCTHCGVYMNSQAPQGCMRKQRRRNLQGLALQSYYAWAAHLGSAWGLHVPQAMVDALEKKVDAQREGASAPFKAAGFMRENGSICENKLKSLQSIAYGARDLCPNCNGTGKVPSEKTEGRTKVNCKACDGTKLALTQWCPRSKSGEISISRDALSESGDELLIEYAEQPSKKIKTTYIPMLRRGRACNVCGSTGCKTKYKPAHEEWCTAQLGEAGYREVPLTPRVDPLKETERAAIEDGVHGIPRKGGIRECIQARPGYVLSSEDYTAGELVTLAQTCLNLVKYSKLAIALNEGVDVHTALAGTFAGKSYEAMMVAKKAKEKWADDLRQVGKKSNFGFGGGMAELEFVLKPCRADMDLFTPCETGPASREIKVNGVYVIERGFRGVRPCILMDHEDYCGRDGEKVLVYNDKPTNSPVCIRCLQAGKRAREAWFTQWPEMRDYFKYIKGVIKTEGPSGTPEVMYDDGVSRGGLGFCDAANGNFQRRLAKAAKAAFCQVQRECVVRGMRVRSSQMMDSQFNGMESPLYGSRAILLFHDEIIAEHPESVASPAAHRISEVMVESLRWQCPQMYKAVKADPCLMRALLKGAEARYLRGGKSPADASDPLVPYEPE